MDLVLKAISIIGLVIFPFAVYYGIALLIRALADNNLFFTYVEEARAKAVLTNGNFTSYVMSYAGHAFKGDISEQANEEDNWDIVDLRSMGEKPKPQTPLPFLKGIRWIGFPPFNTVYVRRFAWASLEERMHEGKLKKEPCFKEEPIDFILLREDVYVSMLDLAECSDNIPLNALLLVGGYIVNPYKAQFRVERWLESTTNLVNTRMRSFFGCHSYEQLRLIEEAMHDGSGTEAEHELSNYFKDTFQDVEKNWGFRLRLVQIYSIDPGSDEADAFIRASTRKYIAEQERDANIATGVGLAARDKAHFEAIAGVPHGPEFYKWTQIAQSGLTTYVEGGGNATPAILTGNQSRPSTNPN